MTPLFRKLNYKNQPEIIVLNPPDSFLPEIDAMKEFARFPEFPGSPDRMQFLLAFVIQQSEVDKLSEELAPELRNDCVLWFAYPKQTSKKYKCGFNRDNGWQVLKTQGFEGVRMIAIDEDWSALRFRKQEMIRKK
jgi:hypothetical protein